jgi:phosphoglycolate phosphatase
MKYKLVIFDWDGTLMDSVAKIVNTVQSAAIRCGQTKPSAEAIRDIIGLSLDVAIARLFPQASQDSQKEIFEGYRDIYSHHDQTPTPMFEGVMALLHQLHDLGYKLAVATGKGRNGLDRNLKLSNTEHLFDITRCAYEAESKPSPDMLKQILSEMALEPEDAIMIGDTEYDLAMAKAIGMDSVGVSFGVHDKERLMAQSPLAVIDAISELKQWI